MGPDGASGTVVGPGATCITAGVEAGALITSGPAATGGVHSPGAGRPFITMGAAGSQSPAAYAGAMLTPEAP